MTDVPAADRRRLDDYLAELRRWVEIETPSADIAAVARLQGLAAEACEQAGLGIEWTGDDGGRRTLVARGGPDDGQPGLLVLAHLDTVHPAGTLASTLAWRRDGDRLYGPGIYDMKGSALMAVAAWRRLAETGAAPRVPVTFLFSPDEEIGSPTSRAAIEAEARRSFAVLVVEPARDGGKIVVARKGSARFTVTATGRAAHSGTNFEDGRSAISEIAAQIPVLEGLTDLAEGITVNVGTIRGGTSVNIVPAQCGIEVDVRLRRLDQAEPVIDAIRALKPRGPDIRLDIEGGLSRPPFDAGEGSRALFAHARQVAATLGIDLVGVSAGGASDGNFTAAMGVPTLDGLGVDGHGAHTLEEHISLSSVVPRIDFFAALLARTDRSCVAAETVSD